MDNSKHRGAITVYLSIIISAVIILSGVLMDIVRIKTAEIQVRRAANTAAASALALYNTKIKNDYGLFALQNSDSTYLIEDIKYYLTNQLVTEGKILDNIYAENLFKKVDFIDLFDYEIENVEVTPLYNLTENEITRQQIVEYMKYRAPTQLAQSFMEKLDYTVSTKEYVTAYKQKTAIEKKLGKVDKLMVQLQASISEINKFAKGHFNRLPDSNSLLIEYCKGILLNTIYSACTQVELGTFQSIEEQKQALEFRDWIRDLHQASVESNAYYKALMDEQLLNCLDAVSGAKKQIVQIREITKQVQQDIDYLENDLIQLKEQNSTSGINHSEFLAAMQKDIHKYQSLIDEDHSQSITEKLNRNLEILSNLQVRISSLPSWLASEAGEMALSSQSSIENWLQKGTSLELIDQSQFNALIQQLAHNTRLISIDETANQYLTLSNIIDKGTSRKGKDPRTGISEAISIVKNETQKASDSKVIKNLSQLPSYFINGSYPNKIFSEGLMDSGDSSDALPKVVTELDADFDEESSFATEGLDFVIDFAQRLKSKLLDMRNEIYINEYIFNIFKDAVEIDDSDTDGKSGTTFFQKGEIEYIIGGNSREDVNKYLVKGQILLIRFGMNTLHVYSDPQKRLKALEAATAAAGFTGFGIPIVHNLIMCAWGTAEALQDIKDIYQGHKVPFFKTVDNWQTDLLSLGFKTKDDMHYEKNIIDFDYHDYLRLLMLAQNKEVKMNRIEDLIQLNMQVNESSFKLSSCNTFIKVNVRVSIKYWSVTKLFMPASLKTPSDRHIINIETWRGY